MTAAAPRVTVIIPVWNAAATIQATLASARAQRVRDIEILVVDDGSTDHSAEIVWASARDDSRIRLIRQANAGVASARNAGLAAATAPLVAWLDADDLWHPAKLEQQLRLFDRHHGRLAFAYTGYRMIDAGGRVQRLPRTIADLSGHSLLRQIATTQFTNVSTMMAPTALVRDLGGFDASLRAAGVEGAEDLLLQLRLAERGPAAFVPQALVGYRLHGANMSRSVARAARSNLLALEQLEKDGVPAPPWVWRLGQGRLAGFVLQMLAAGNPAGAWGFFRQLMAKAPRETLTTLARSGPFLVRHALRLRPQDPALGQPFAEADPATVPIEGHMLLSRRMAERLRAADRQRAGQTALQNTAPELATDG